MTWSYSGDPGSSPRDAVRFAIGDILSTDQQFSNEEIDYVLAGQPDVTMTALELCKSLIARYARYCSQSVGAISVSYGERRSNYEALKVELLRQLGPTPYAGGISVGDKEAQEADDDYDQPTFKRKMDQRTG